MSAYHNDPLWRRIAEGLDPEKGKRIEETWRSVDAMPPSLEKLKAFNDLLVLKDVNDENRRNQLRVYYDEMVGERIPEGWEPPTEWFSESSFKPSEGYSSGEASVPQWISPGIPDDEANLPSDVVPPEDIWDVGVMSTRERNLSRDRLLDELNRYPADAPGNEDKRRQIIQRLKSVGHNLSDMDRVAALLRLEP